MKGKTMKIEFDENSNGTVKHGSSTDDTLLHDIL